MSSQGRPDAEKDRASVRELGRDLVDADFQAAVKWRNRVKRGDVVYLHDSRRDVTMMHVDALIRYATAMRGRVMTK